MKGRETTAESASTVAMRETGGMEVQIQLIAQVRSRWHLLEEFAGKARLLDRGRVDVRNTGLRHFKKDHGAQPEPLSYAFFPKAPRQISTEVLSGPAKLVSRLWRFLPSPMTRMLGSALYGYFA